MSRSTPTTVVVTGAGSGLGAAVAVRLARGGSVVGVLDRDGDAARRVAGELGPEAVALVADTTDDASLGACEDSSSTTPALLTALSAPSLVTR